MRARYVAVAGLVLWAGCGTSSTDDAGADATTSSTVVDSTTTVQDATVPATAASEQQPAEATSSTAPDDATEAQGSVGVVDIPDAVAIGVAASRSGRPAVAWTSSSAVHLARFDVTGAALEPPLEVSGGLEPVGHLIERPAVSVGLDDVVHVAFTSPVMGNATVYLVDVVDGEPSAPVAISGEPRPETNLVHMTSDDDAPVLAWLEDATLSVALRSDGELVEHERVDDLTCDCCNPVPVRLGDRVVVAYRDQLRTGDAIIRDVAVTATDDGGATWSDPLRIADDHWFLDGCPFSGPSAATVGGEYLVAWMDARQTVHPDQAGSTIWVDRSSDGGATFGTDLALTHEGVHRWPSIAVDGDETVHLVWEVQATDGGLAYSSSNDGGRTFSDHTLLVPNTTDSGLRRAPSAVVQGDHLLVSWIDSAGGHVAGFDIDHLAESHP